MPETKTWGVVTIHETGAGIGTGRSGHWNRTERWKKRKEQHSFQVVPKVSSNQKYCISIQRSPYGLIKERREQISVTCLGPTNSLIEWIEYAFFFIDDSRNTTQTAHKASSERRPVIKIP